MINRVLRTVVFLSLSGTPVAAQLPEWRLIPSLRIGSVDRPNYAFGSVDGLTVDGAGNIYVLDSVNDGVLVYDSAGRFVRRIGRSGPGPGEFNRAVAIGQRGDSIWVADLGQGRLTFFSREGEVLHAVDGGEFARLLLENGLIVGSPGVAIPREGDPRMVRTAVVTQDRAGVVRDTLFESRALILLSLGPGSVMVFGPFDDQPLFHGAPDGSSVVVVARTAATSADSATFRVRSLAADGGTRFDRTYRYAPRAVRPEIVDSLIAERVKDAPGAQAAQVRAQAYLPDFSPPITDVVVSREGRVWLRREESYGPYVTWHALDESGIPAGGFAAPSDLKIHFADSESVWGVERDELDVPYVVRYTLTRSNGR